MLDPAQLEAMSKAELNALAAEFDIENPTKVKKDDLVAQILELQAKRSGLEKANGVLDVLPEGYGFLRREGYLVGGDDIYISQSQIRRFELRRGDLVAGQVRAPKENEKYYGIVKIETINGEAPEAVVGRRMFDQLDAEPPTQRLALEQRGDLATRALDLFAPLGKGERALIIAPPRADVLGLFTKIARGLSRNHPDVVTIVALLDERPEAVAHAQRTIEVELATTTFEEHAEAHVTTAELVFERAKRLVEMGRDVVVLMDSLTRVVRAYGALVHHKPEAGRVDGAALQKVKRLFAAARAAEGGGSLTLLATVGAGTTGADALVTEELAHAANAEIVLSRELAAARAYPPIDLLRSGNEYEESLLGELELRRVSGLRRSLAGVASTEASERIYAALVRTQTNAEFLSAGDRAGV